MPTITIKETLYQRVNAAASRYQVSATEVVEGLIQTHLEGEDAKSEHQTVASLARTARKANIKANRRDVSMRSSELLTQERRALLGQWISD